MKELFNIEKHEVENAPEKGWIFLTLDTFTPSEQTFKCKVSDVRKVIKNKKTVFERIWGPCIPYFDFDIKNAKIEDKDGICIHIIETLKSIYPKGYVQCFDGSRQVGDDYKISLHAIVRSVGFYENGLKLLASLPPLIKELPGFDDSIYKNTGKSQLFKLPYCRKPEEKKAPLMKMCEVKDNKLVSIEIDDVDKNLFPAFYVTHLAKETFVIVPDEVERKERTEIIMAPHDNQYPTPTHQDIEKLVRMLKADRAGPHNKRIYVIWCLRNIYESYGIETYDLAEEFYRSAPDEWKDDGDGKLHAWYWGATKAGLNMGSLCMWASEDNPEAYQQWKDSTRPQQPVTYFEPDNLMDVVTNSNATIENIEDFMRGCIFRIEDGKKGFYMTRRIDGYANAGRGLFTGEEDYDFFITNAKGKQERIGWYAIFKQLRQKPIWRPNVFREVTFKPSFSEIPVVPSALNLFTGFLASPASEFDEKDRNLNIFLQQIREVFCDDDKECDEYFQNWIAHFMQYPHKKMGVALVIQSEQGVGKSLVWNAFQKGILGQYFHTIDTLAELTNGFNVLMANKLLIHLDEMNIFGGSISTANQLKGIITRDKITVVEKGKDGYTLPDLCNYVISSNCRNSVRVENSDRRFAVFLASSKNRNNHEWFASLNNAIIEGAPQIIRYFLNRNIEGWNPQHIPDTKIRQEMKRAVLSSSIQFINAIIEGTYFFKHLSQFIPMFEGQDVVNELKVSGAELYTEYRQWAQDNGEKETSSRNFHVEMRKIGMPEQKTILRDERRFKGYCFTLQDLKKYMATYLLEPI